MNLCADMHTKWQNFRTDPYGQGEAVGTRADGNSTYRPPVNGELSTVPFGHRALPSVPASAPHRDPAGLRHLLTGARWGADAVRDDLRECVGQQLDTRGVLIIADTGFINRGIMSAGVSRQYTSTCGAFDNSVCTRTSGRMVVTPPRRPGHLQRRPARSRSFHLASIVPIGSGMLFNAAVASAQAVSPGYSAERR
ncbi:transposase [Streptomyces sp. NPDC001980]|uniref:transposase n=1 Tax=Streptomyces sp. NPDC001980 TaxID=3157126 RepID=UPI003320F641